MHDIYIYIYIYIIGWRKRSRRGCPVGPWRSSPITRRPGFVDRNKCMYIYIYIYTYLLSIRLFIYVCVDIVCLSLSLYIYIYIYIHTRICTVCSRGAAKKMRSRTWLIIKVSPSMVGRRKAFYDTGNGTQMRESHTGCVCKFNGLHFMCMTMCICVARI